MSFRLNHLSITSLQTLKKVSVSVPVTTWQGIQSSSQPSIQMEQTPSPWLTMRLKEATATPCKWHASRDLPFWSALLTVLP